MVAWWWLVVTFFIRPPAPPAPRRPWPAAGAHSSMTTCRRTCLPDSAPAPDARGTTARRRQVSRSGRGGDGLRGSGWPRHWAPRPYVACVPSSRRLSVAGRILRGTGYAPEPSGSAPPSRRRPPRPSRCAGAGIRSTRTAAQRSRAWRASRGVALTARAFASSSSTRLPPLAPAACLDAIFLRVGTRRRSSPSACVVAER